MFGLKRLLEAKLRENNKNKTVKKSKLITDLIKV